MRWPNPNVVLMDEPFGALDPITRDALHDLVIELQEEYNNTFYFVTHDMDEALKLADQLLSGMMERLFNMIL